MFDGPSVRSSSTVGASHSASPADDDPDRAADLRQLRRVRERLRLRVGGHGRARGDEADQRGRDDDQRKRQVEEEDRHERADGDRVVDRA